MLPAHARESLLTDVVHLEVRDFRNLALAELDPVAGALTVVTGENGAGKTSLLEAIGYASTLRSFRGSPREALVRTGCDQAFVRAEVETEGRRSLVEIQIAPSRRDQVFCNRQRVQRGDDLLEVLRVTVFTPDDLPLVKGGPQERRDFLDDVVVSSDPRLWPTRQAVERILRQRNVLLRQAGGRAAPDVVATLDVWDEQLVRAGEQLVSAREAVVAELAPHAAAAFARLTRLDEPLRLEYRRSFTGDLAAALSTARPEDLRRGVTTAGPHRDDLAVSLGPLDARTRLSQGRQRSATLALRLAAHEVVTLHAGTRPVLLLDDAFSELDPATAHALLEELPAGQAVLTTAGPLPEGVAPARTVRIAGGRLGG